MRNSSATFRPTSPPGLAGCRGVDVPPPPPQYPGISAEAAGSIMLEVGGTVCSDNMSLISQVSFS